MASTSEGALLTDRHRREQVRLAITADSQARRVWDRTLDLDDLKGSQPIWKNAILDLIETWWRISADKAAAYLPRFREAETGEPTDIEVGVPRFDRAQAAQRIDWTGATNVLWHIARGETQEAAYAAARSLFLGVFHEAVLTGGRTTIENWAKKDPRAIGWRRVSDGDPCAFCAMLVTRGPVYTSRDKALHTTNPAPGIPAGTLHKYHPHCGCTVEIVCDDWQPTERERQWIDDYYRAAESLPGKTPRTAKTVLPILRKDGSFRDSAARRGTPEYLAERRRLRFKRKTEALSRQTEQPKQKEPTAAIEWPDNVQAPDETVVNHILHGDPEKKLGGHLHGTDIEGKTEFPESWDQARVIDAIRQVMENPDWVAPPPNPRAMYRFGKTIDGVQVEVGAYLVNGWKYVIDRAYPRGGIGVTRNVKGRKIDMPPSKGKHWRRN